MRIPLRIAMMMAGLLVCLPLHYLWRLFKLESPWPRIFLGWVGYAAGARLLVKGIPLPSHVLFISNHLSWLDIMLIASASGSAFVSKDEVAHWPIIGWLAGLNNTIFVARTQKGAVLNQIHALRAALASGQPVSLFPEGTTEGGTKILPFRPSLIACMFPPIHGVKIQPVALDYGPLADEIAWTNKESAMTNIKRILARRGSFPVIIHFLEPVDPADFPCRKTVAETIRKKIMVTLAASETTNDSL